MLMKMAMTTTISANTIEGSASTTTTFTINTLIAGIARRQSSGACDSALFCRIRCCSVRFGSVWFGSLFCGSLRFGAAQRGRILFFVSLFVFLRLPISVSLICCESGFLSSCLCALSVCRVCLSCLSVSRCLLSLFVSLPLDLLVSVSHYLSQPLPASLSVNLYLRWPSRP